MSQSANKIKELQTRIEKLKHDLSTIKQLEQPQPELINSTNMLRTNEYLTREIQQQSELLSLYEKYSKELENLVVSTSEIKFKIKQLKSKIRSKKSIKKPKRRIKSQSRVKRKTQRKKKKNRKLRKRRY